jgi:hypothetical protein
MIDTKRLRELEAAATPGEWSYVESDFAESCHAWVFQRCARNDADLICWLRNNAVAVADETDRATMDESDELRAENERLRKRTTAQRRELRAVNRKIANLTVFLWSLPSVSGRSAQDWAEALHRNDELSRKLIKALEKVT